MKTIGERLKAFREYKGLSQPAFVDGKKGINQANISQWERNESEPRNKKAIALQKAYPDLNMKWLLEGIGEMLGNQNHSTIDIGDSYSLLKHIEELMKEKARLLDLLEKALTTNANFPEDNMYTVPMVLKPRHIIQPAA